MQWEIKTTLRKYLKSKIPLLIIVAISTKSKKNSSRPSGEFGKMAAQAGTAVVDLVGALAGAATLGRGTIGRLANKPARCSEELKDRAAKTGWQRCN